VSPNVLIYSIFPSVAQLHWQRSKVCQVICGIPQNYWKCGLYIPLFLQCKIKGIVRRVANGKYTIKTYFNHSNQTVITVLAIVLGMGFRLTMS